MLAVNASFNPGFWQLHWRDGHLYGSVIDILNRAAPLANARAWRDSRGLIK